MQKAKVFYSYAHTDEEFRVQLETQLRILERNGLIVAWHDRRIAAGQLWEEQIDLNLDQADLILLLISSDFLASDYCYETETIRALERHEEKDAVVIPIILRPCLWHDSHFAKLQALPRDGRAVSLWANRDEAWLDVASGIQAVVKSLPDKVVATGQTSKPLSLTQTEAIDTDLVLRFLSRFNRWYFSPLRIQKWGGQQPGYERLSIMPTSEISAALRDLHNQGKLTTTKSQKGNVIYRAG